MSFFSNHLQILHSFYNLELTQIRLEKKTMSEEDEEQLKLITPESQINKWNQRLADQHGQTQSFPPTLGNPTQKPILQFANRAKAPDEEDLLSDEEAEEQPNSSAPLAKLEFAGFHMFEEHGRNDDDIDDVFVVEPDQQEDEAGTQQSAKLFSSRAPTTKGALPSGQKRRKHPVPRKTDGKTTRECIDILQYWTKNGEQTKQETGSTNGVIATQTPAHVETQSIELYFHTNSVALPSFAERLERQRLNETTLGIKEIDFTEMMAAEKRSEESLAAFEKATQLATHRDVLRNPDGKIDQPRLQTVDALLAALAEQKDQQNLYQGFKLITPDKGQSEEPNPYVGTTKPFDPAHVAASLLHMFDSKNAYYSKRDDLSKVSVPVKSVPTISRHHIAKMLWLANPILPFKPCMSEKLRGCVAQILPNLNHPFNPNAPLIAYYSPEDYMHLMRGEPLIHSDKSATQGADAEPSPQAPPSPQDEMDELLPDEDEQLDQSPSKRQKTEGLDSATGSGKLGAGYTQTCEFCYRNYVEHSVLESQQNNHRAFEEIPSRYYHTGPGEYSVSGMHKQTESRAANFSHGIFGNMRLFKPNDFVPVMGHWTQEKLFKVDQILLWDEFCRRFGPEEKAKEYAQQHGWIAGWQEIGEFYSINESSFYEVKPIDPYVYSFSTPKVELTVDAVLIGYFKNRKKFGEKTALQNNYAHLFMDLFECLENPNYLNLACYRGANVEWRRWCLHKLELPAPDPKSHKIYYTLLMKINTILKFIYGKQFGTHEFTEFILQKMKYYLNAYAPLLQWIQKTNQISDAELTQNIWQNTRVGVWLSPLLLFYPYAERQIVRPSDQCYVPMEQTIYRRNNPLEVVQNYYAKLRSEIEKKTPEDMKTLLFPKTTQFVKSDYSESMKIYAPVELLDAFASIHTRLKCVWERQVYALRTYSAKFVWNAPNLKRCRRALTSIINKPPKPPKPRKQKRKKSDLPESEQKTLEEFGVLKTEKPEHTEEADEDIEEEVTKKKKRRYKTPAKSKTKSKPPVDPEVKKLEQQRRIVLRALTNSEKLIEANFLQIEEWVVKQTQTYLQLLEAHLWCATVNFSAVVEWVQKLSDGDMFNLLKETNYFESLFPEQGKVKINETHVNTRPWAMHRIFFACCYRVWVLEQLYTIEPISKENLRYNLILLRNSHLRLFRVICEDPSNLLTDDQLNQPLTAKSVYPPIIPTIFHHPEVAAPVPDNPPLEEGELFGSSSSDKADNAKKDLEQLLGFDDLDSLLLRDHPLEEIPLPEPIIRTESIAGASPTKPQNPPSMPPKEGKLRGERAEVFDFVQNKEKPKLTVSILEFYFPYPEREIHCGMLPDYCGSLHHVDFFGVNGTAAQLPWCKAQYKKPDRCCNVREFSSMARTNCEDPIYYRHVMLELELSLKGLYHHCSVVPSFAASIIVDELFEHCTTPEWKTYMNQFILNNEMLFAKATSESLCYMLKQTPALLECLTDIYKDWFSSRTFAAMDMARKCLDLEKTFANVTQIIEKRIHLQTNRTIFRLFETDFVSWVCIYFKKTNNYRYENRMPLLPPSSKLTPDQIMMLKAFIHLRGPDQEILAEELLDIGFTEASVKILNELFNLFQIQLSKSNTTPPVFSKLEYEQPDDVFADIEVIIQSASAAVRPDLRRVAGLKPDKDDDGDEENLDSEFNPESMSEAAGNNPKDGEDNLDEDNNINNTKIYQTILRLGPWQFVLMWQFFFILRNYSGIRPVALKSMETVRRQQAAVWQKPVVQTMKVIPPNLHNVVIATCCRNVKNSWPTHVGWDAIGYEDVAYNMEDGTYNCAKRNHRAGKILTEQEVRAEHEKLEKAIELAEQTSDPKIQQQARKKLFKAEKKHMRQADRRILKPDCNHEVFSVSLTGVVVEGPCKNPGSKKNHKDAPLSNIPTFPVSGFWQTPCCGIIYSYKHLNFTPAGYACGVCASGNKLREMFQQVRCSSCRRAVGTSEYFIHQVFDDVLTQQPGRVVFCNSCNSSCHHLLVSRAEDNRHQLSLLSVLLNTIGIVKRR